MKILFFILFICITPIQFIGCVKDNNNSNECPCDATYTKRVGAICNDGTRSYATGSGACSHHGGVDYWLCEK